MHWAFTAGAHCHGPQMAKDRACYKSFILQHSLALAHLHAHVSGYLSIKSCGKCTDFPIISSWLPKQLHLDQGEAKGTGQQSMAMGNRHPTWHPFIQIAPAALGRLMPSRICSHLNLTLKFLTLQWSLADSAVLTLSMLGILDLCSVWKASSCCLLASLLTERTADHEWLCACPWPEPALCPCHQSAPSSPEEFTPSSASTTGSPWTRWPPSAGRCTPPSLPPASPSTPTCSLSSRWGPVCGELFSVCWPITSGRSLSTFMTLTEVRAALWQRENTHTHTHQDTANFQ